MIVQGLDHVNIRTALIAETLAFYGGVLGMSCRPGPGGTDTTRGGWIYDGHDRPVIHLGPAGTRYPGDAVRGGEEPGRGSGAIDHVALECVGYEELMAKLKAANLTITTNEVPIVNLRQIFVKDPNGITLELNFRGTSS